MKTKAMLIAALALAVLFAAAPAQGLKIRLGNLIVQGDGGFKPESLPKFKDAPITIHGGGSVSTVNGDWPPVIKEITLEYDRHGSLQTLGLPKCRRGQLEASTVPDARRRCPGAIVGKGHGRGVVVFPESRPIPVSSPITIFNGPPKHGNPTVLAHAYLTQPVVTTFIVPIVIERIHKGLYGYRTKATIPKIAGGAGVPISGHLRIGKRWTYRGVRRSYIKARCETGRLQARGQFTFKDGTFLSGTLLKPCQVRR